MTDWAHRLHYMATDLCKHGIFSQFTIVAASLLQVQDCKNRDIYVRNCTTFNRVIDKLIRVGKICVPMERLMAIGIPCFDKHGDSYTLKLIELNNLTEPIHNNEQLWDYYIERIHVSMLNISAMRRATIISQDRNANSILRVSDFFD